MTPPTSAALRDLFTDAPYFLSPANPAATADQRDVETRALELIDHPALVSALDVARMRFDILAGTDQPDEARAGMDRRLREWAFGHTVLALNSDPDRPRISSNLLGPPHTWFGHTVPGSRGPGTGENADCWYAMAPIDSHSRYELVGKVQSPPASDCPLYIAGTIAMVPNVAGLDWRDVHINDDGIFAVTIDPNPADGRTNHLRTTVDANFLFFRDARWHWSERPNAYRIRRLDPPLRPPMTLEDQIALAARYIVEDVPMMWFYRQSLGCLATNTVTTPLNAGPFGGMPTQATARGRLELNDDEAYVLTLTSGGASYWILASYDWWMMSDDFGTRTATLNNTQSKANADGTYTYVFSARDPGVHNWIDTVGRRHTFFVNRWQQLPRDAGRPLPLTSGQVVKLKDLERVLPPSTPRVSAVDRAAQLAERAELFACRYAV